MTVIPVNRHATHTHCWTLHAQQGALLVACVLCVFGGGRWYKSSIACVCVHTHIALTAIAAEPPPQLLVRRRSLGQRRAQLVDALGLGVVVTAVIDSARVGRARRRRRRTRRVIKTLLLQRLDARPQLVALSQQASGRGLAVTQRAFSALQLRQQLGARRSSSPARRRQRSCSGAGIHVRIFLSATKHNLPF